MVDPVHLIWNPDTGIADLDGGLRTYGASEIPGIKAVWRDQRTRLAGTKLLSDFTDRLSREWAIETGIIENLYDIERGITQTLIERGFQAELLSHGSTNRPREYVLALLRDQKDSLDGIFDFVKSDRKLSVSYIKELHAALLRSQDTTEGIDALGRIVEVPLIRGDWKKLPNSPVRDGVTYAYCPPEQVASEMDRLVSLHQRHVTEGVTAEVQAAWLHHRFTQIHPFQDGNGRVARAIASLILVKEELFPLVVTRDDKPVYLDALESADRGILWPLVDFFARLQRTQFARATALSESVLAAGANVQEILSGLLRAAEKTADEKRESLQRVFEYAHAIKDNLQKRLEDITPDVSTVLLRLSALGRAGVSVSNPETEHYYRSQIIQNARDHLHYYANTSDYRAWVALNLVWSRRARLVFTLHGIGSPFTGSLVCAPFLEFRDADGDGQIQSILTPIADEGFVFFYNDKQADMLKRFEPWREQVLAVALQELSRNL